MCFKKYLVIFLMLLLTLPAFCGWQAFKKPLESSSVATVVVEEVDETTTTKPAEKSLTEESKDMSPTLELSKSYEESSEVYDTTLDEIKVTLEEKKATHAVKEIKPLVDTLISSKEAMQENYATAKSTLVAQEKHIKSLEKKLSGVNFALGLSLGYKFPMEFSPGVDFQMRANNWIMSLGVNYSIDAMNPVMTDPKKLETRVGVLYEF